MKLKSHGFIDKQYNNLFLYVRDESAICLSVATSAKTTILLVTRIYFEENRWTPPQKARSGRSF